MYQLIARGYDFFSHGNLSSEMVAIRDDVVLRPHLSSSIRLLYVRGNISSVACNSVVCNLIINLKLPFLMCCSRIRGPLAPFKLEFQEQFAKRHLAKLFLVSRLPLRVLQERCNVCFCIGNHDDYCTFWSICIWLQWHL